MEEAFSGLTFAQLEIFFAVAESGGFARAGERLHLSQPAVSKSIARLEQMLELRLFARTTRALQLTDAGKALYAAWQPCVEEMQRVYRQAVEQQRRRVLRVGLLNTARPGRFFDAIAERFRQACPEVLLEVESEYMTTLEKQLREGAYDVIFVPDFERYSLEGLAWKWAAQDQAYVVLPQSDPLARRAEVRLQELTAHEFVVLSDAFSPNYLRDLRERFAGIGAQPRISRSYRKAYDIRAAYRPTDGVLLHDNFFDYTEVPGAVRLPLADQKNGIICVWNPKRVCPELEKFLIEIIYNESL